MEKYCQYRGSAPTPDTAGVTSLMFRTSRTYIFCVLPLRRATRSGSRSMEHQGSGKRTVRSGTGVDWIMRVVVVLYRSKMSSSRSSCSMAGMYTFQGKVEIGEEVMGLCTRQVV